MPYLFDRFEIPDEEPARNEPAPQPPRPMTVSELTEQIKSVVEEVFPTVCVSGEISNFSRPQSGHCYFTLKDEQAQLKAAMWRTSASKVRFDLRDGQEVVCRGRIEVYAPRGTYQLIVERIEPVGVGALELALRQLRDRLAKEGLFDPARKRPLPPFVKQIAVVTSPTGAAIHDFLQVLARRWRGADVLIVPTRVQGEGAAEEIAAAIATANRIARPIDCLVVARGGGSLEDLWAFNEEPVVRAIAASRIPVISAVGHEVDVTLADLVADVRALTPSEAAEIVAPASEEILAALTQTQRRISAVMRNRLLSSRAKIESIAARTVFRRPLQKIRDIERRLDERSDRINRAVRRQYEIAAQTLGGLSAKLETLSPLNVLARGYSLTVREDDGKPVRSASTLKQGDVVRTRFAEGEAVARVEKIL